MKYLTLLCFVILCNKNVRATPVYTDTSDLLVKSLEDKFNGSTKEMKDSITVLNSRISKIDSLLGASSKVKNRADSLQTRIELLEIKSKLSENIVLETYSFNYGVALSNLFGMQQDLQSLDLMNAALEFSNSISEISNPNSYKDFKDWYDRFKLYITENKDKDARFSVLASLLTTGGQVVGKIPTIGPIAIPFFNGISKFIDMFSGRSEKDKIEREKATEMLTLMSRINQFDYSINAFESGWQILKAELDSIKSKYSRILFKNIRKINLTAEQLNEGYINETLLSNRNAFCNRCTDSCAKLVEREKQKDEINWKNYFYGDMMEVQALRVQFGILTSRMGEYLKGYDKVLKVYQEDPILKENISRSQSSLKILQRAFSTIFSPTKYIEQSSYMYKVQ